MQEHTNKLQKSMLTSLTERKVKAQEQKVNPLLGIFTGKIKPIRLLKKVFSTKKKLTPLDSVYSTNLWKVLEFISIETAEETL